MTGNNHRVPELLHIEAAPDLHGAACVDHRDLFDAAATRGGVKFYPQAIQVCESCPALGPCRQWVGALPRTRRPFGVTAATIRTPYTA
jgi:hypothetical protein